MWDSSFTKYQHHPLDANGKLLRRFYEPLSLLRVMDPTRGAQRPDLTQDRGLDEQSKLWRNFLDQLAFLCDSEKGGDTVTAIAAQRNVERPVFCLATNSNSRFKARDHVCWILSLLGQMHTTGKPAHELEEEIFGQCINFSRHRIDVNCKWLMQAMEKAEWPKDELMSSEGT